VSELTILVPTRQRPHAIAALAQAFADTCTEGTRLIFCIDGCPRVEEYRAEFIQATRYAHLGLRHGQRRRLVGTLNHHSVDLATGDDPPFAVGYMGDDHCPITTGWDAAFLGALHDLGSGVVYGDDQIQGANLPTQVAITTDIVKALGYFAPPVLTHMYCDNFWKDLGEGAGCLRYLPEVIIRHGHPSQGHAAWDDSYRESNSPAQYEADRVAYAQYCRDHLPFDIAQVRGVRD
jgi:hypothetical protein